MDLDFLQTLKSMADVEKDPHFRSKKYVVVDREEQPVKADEVPVVLQYPDNVLIVESKTGEPMSSYPAIPSKNFWFYQLSDALTYAACNSYKDFDKGFKGCSIVVYPGLYIDPTAQLGKTLGGPTILGIGSLPWKQGYSVEIVGIREVRILSLLKQMVLLCPCRINLTMKNVLVYEHPKVDIGLMSHEATILAMGTNICLVDVRIHSTSSKTLWRSDGDNTSFKAVDCSFFGYEDPFHTGKSTFDIERCRWTGMNGVPVVDKDAVLNMKDSSIYGFGHVAVFGRATLRGCQFISDKYPREILRITSGGRLVMSECSLSGANLGVAVRDSHSKASIERCEITNCTFAVSAYMNASVTVADCTLEVDNIVGLKRNVAGKVLFRRNLHRKRPKGVSQHYNELEVISRRWPETAIFFLDSVSKLEVVDHDFKRKYVVEFEDEELVSHSIGATRKSREDFEKHNQEFCAEMNWSVPKSSKTPGKGAKWCLHCRKEPKEAPGTKFMYCSRCQKVCYCSKKCQQANWKDHKLLCRKD